MRKNVMMVALPLFLLAGWVGGIPAALAGSPGDKLQIVFIETDSVADVINHVTDPKASIDRMHMGDQFIVFRGQQHLLRAQFVNQLA